MGYNNSFPDPNSPEPELANRNYTNSFGGTSSATPLAAGIAGLLLTLNPDLTRTEVQQILQHTAEKIEPDVANYNANGFSSTHGYGRVNAHRAVVPSEKISTSQTQLRPNEPFTVTVTASAPYGLSEVWWYEENMGDADMDPAQIENPNGAAVFSHTWRDVRIAQPGRYTLAADARDVRFPAPRDGYPHQASEGSGIATIEIEVVDID